jgi:hypothetical protein
MWQKIGVCVVLGGLASASGCIFDTDDDDDHDTDESASIDGDTDVKVDVKKD